MSAIRQLQGERDALQARVRELERERKNEANAYDSLLRENEALQSDLSALRAANRWIPVSEGLPEAMHSDAMTRISMLVMCGEWYKEPVKGYYLGGLLKQWRVEGCNGTAPVTHWRPLPPGPNSQGILDSSEGKHGASKHVRQPAEVMEIERGNEGQPAEKEGT